jgi:hypothetical protein
MLVKNNYARYVKRIVATAKTFQAASSLDTVQFVPGRRQVRSRVDTFPILFDRFPISATCLSQFAVLNSN